MCVAESRINIKYGGRDITEVFFRMMLQNSFPYKDINLWRRYDFLLAEELKTKLATLNDSDVSVVNHDFHLRRPDKDTKKYVFRTYDEVMLASMTHFRPSLTPHAHKLNGRRSLWDRSYDIYDNMPNDPMSTAQAALYQSLSSKITDVSSSTTAAPGADATHVRPLASFGAHLNAVDTTPRSSIAGSPGPESATPNPGFATPSGLGEITANGSVTGGASAAAGGLTPYQVAIRMWEEYDRTIPIMPLDKAVCDSISHAAKGDEKKMRDFFSGIMVVGGGAKVPGFNHALEERIRALKGSVGKDMHIIIGVPPRELDQQVIVWKGASVFGKLRHTNDSWIKQREYDMLGGRLLSLKCMWMF